MTKGITKNKLKKFFLGMNFTDGAIFKIVIYGLLISFGYIYLYPVLYMIVQSFMSVDDLINTGVIWVPTTFEFANYVKAFEVLKLPQSLFETTGYVLMLSVIITVTSAIIGYGFARYNFPLKKLFFALVLATFVLPTQITMISNMVIYGNMGIINSMWTMILPAIFGQGVNAPIFILIFYNFFKTIPQALIESAEIDGANQIKIFTKIAVPLAIPSVVIVFLFSFVWYWNETTITGLYVGSAITLPLKLQVFRASYETMFPPGSTTAKLNEAIIMAGNVLTILPLLILYFIGQKQFTQSIEKSGITGE